MDFSYINLDYNNILKMTEHYICDYDNDYDTSSVGILNDLMDTMENEEEKFIVEEMVNEKVDHPSEFKGFINYYTYWQSIDGAEQKERHLDIVKMKIDYANIIKERITNTLNHMSDDELIQASNSLGYLVNIYKMDKLNEFQIKNPNTEDIIKNSKKNSLFKQSDKYFYITNPKKEQPKIYSFSNLNDFTSPLRKKPYNMIDRLLDADEHGGKREIIPYDTSYLAKWAINENNDMGNRQINEILHNYNFAFKTNNSIKQKTKEKDIEAEL